MLTLKMIVVATAVLVEGAHGVPPWAASLLSLDRVSEGASSSSYATNGIGPQDGIGKPSSVEDVHTGCVPPGISYSPLDIPPDPSEVWANKAAYQGMRKVDYDVKIGQYAKALESFDRLARGLPLAKLTYFEVQPALEYLTGGTSLAFRDTVGVVKARLQDRQAAPWLLLAAVSAANGRVVPGQLEYCEKAILADASLAFPGYSVPHWNHSKPKDVEAAACLAYSSQAPFDIPFLERARSLAPSSPYIAAVLASRYQTAQQFGKARTLIRMMVKKPMSAKEREWFEQELGYDSGKPDKLPIRPVFDDGGA